MKKNKDRAKDLSENFNKLMKSVEDITEKNKTKNAIPVDDKEKQK